MTAPASGSYHRVLNGERAGAIVMVVTADGESARCESFEPLAPGRVDIPVSDLKVLTDEQRDAFFMRDTLRSAKRYDRPVVLSTSHGEISGDLRVRSIDEKTVTVTAGIAYSTFEMADIVAVRYDVEAEAAARVAREREAADEVAAAYKTISQALNSSLGMGALRDALAGEHPTLLGKLANEVLAAVDARDGDLRVGMLTRTVREVAEATPDFRVSELRQPLV